MTKLLNALDNIFLLHQDEFLLLQRQFEGRELELRRLKDESRLRADSCIRAEGGERGQETAFTISSRLMHKKLHGV